MRELALYNLDLMKCLPEMEGLCHDLFECSISLHMFDRKADYISTCADSWVAN